MCHHGPKDCLPLPPQTMSIVSGSQSEQLARCATDVIPWYYLLVPLLLHSPSKCISQDIVYQTKLYEY